KSFNNKIINKLREIIEFYLIKNKVKSVIFASPFFNYYYKIEDKPIITLNNKPSKKLIKKQRKNYIAPYLTVLQNKMVVGFIGTVRYEDILYLLIDTVENNKEVVLLIAGNGPSY